MRTTTSRTKTTRETVTTGSSKHSEQCHSHVSPVYTPPSHLSPPSHFYVTVGHRKLVAFTAGTSRTRLIFFSLMCALLSSPQPWHKALVILTMVAVSFCCLFSLPSLGPRPSYLYRLRPSLMPRQELAAGASSLFVFRQLSFTLFSLQSSAYYTLPRSNFLSVSKGRRPPHSQNAQSLFRLSSVAFICDAVRGLFRSDVKLRTGCCIRLLQCDMEASKKRSSRRTLSLSKQPRVERIFRCFERCAFIEGTPASLRARTLAPVRFFIW